MKFKEYGIPLEFNMETKRDWEVVQEDTNVSKTERLRIANGWLYRTTVNGQGVAMVFVPAVWDA